MANKNYKTLLFLLNPFLSAIDSLIHIRDKKSQTLLYCWFLVFGCAFCALNEAADSFRYVENFQYEHSYSFFQYMSIIHEYWTFELNVKDIYALTVNYIVGRFSDNYHWTYLIYASVFGLFYIKSIKIFLRYNIGNKFAFYSLFFLLCFSNPIFNINGMRFWTASWIGVYVALRLFIDHDYKYALLLVLMPLIHGSSVIWVAFMAIAFLTSKFQNVWIVLFIASSFVSGLSALDTIGQYSGMLPQFMQNQLWAYTESGGALERIERESQVNGYWDVLNALPGFFLLLMTYLLIYYRKKINEDERGKHLLTVLLALSAVTNFVSAIPSMGRFQTLVIPILVIVWTMNYDVMKRYNKLFYAVPIVYAYRILYWYRHMRSVTEIYLYIFPAPLTIIKYLFLS